MTVAMGNPVSPWSREDAMNLKGKITEENVHLDHIFHDDSSNSGEETSLVGTRIDNFLDAAANIIQRHLRINVNGDDEDLDIDDDNVDEEEEDEYDGDDDESMAFDYSVFSKHTVESISSHHSGSRAPSDNKAKKKDSQRDSNFEQDGASVGSEKKSRDERSVGEKSFTDLRTIRENTAAEGRKSSSSSFSAKTKTHDDKSTCSGAESYDEKSFAGLRSVLQLENSADEENAFSDKGTTQSSHENESTNGKSVSGGKHSREKANDDGSVSGFQSLGMHSTQETTIDEGSTTGFQSLGMHSTHETTIDEGSTSGSRSGLNFTQETTTDGESVSVSRSTLHSTQETSIDEESTSGSPSLAGMHSIQETTIETRSSFGLRTIQERPFDEGIIDDNNFPKEEGMFGELSKRKKSSNDDKSQEGARSQSESRSRGTRSSRSRRSNLESSYDEDTRDSDSEYFSDEYTNYDTTVTQSTMTSKNYPKLQVTQRRDSTGKGKKVQNKKNFYVPENNRNREIQKPGSNFVDVRDFFIYSDENSIVTKSSYKPPPPKKQAKPSQSRRGTKTSHRRTKMKRRIDRQIKEEDSYYSDDQTADSDTRFSSLYENSTVFSGSYDDESRTRYDDESRTRYDDESRTRYDDESRTQYYDDESRSEMTRSERTSCTPRLRAISDDVSQITMSVALQAEDLDESFDGTNSLTTHQSHFDSRLRSCDDRSAYTDDATNLDDTSIALLSGRSNCDDDQSGKNDSVFDHIRDMGLSIWRKTKDKARTQHSQPETEKSELEGLDQEGMKKARLIEIMKREAKLEEAAWKRIELKQAERKDSELKQPVETKVEFNHFDLKQSFAIKRIDESFLSQQDGDNSLIEPVEYAEETHSTVSNAISDSVLYNRERSQILQNRRMARNIRKVPSKSTDEMVIQSNLRDSVSDVGVSGLYSHERSLEGFLTRKPSSVGQSLVAIPARGSTPRDKLRARMMARSKISAIDAAKVKRDFFAKSPTSTGQAQTPSKVALKSSLKYTARVASPAAALSPTSILKTMAPQLPSNQYHRSALLSTTSPVLQAKRVSFATPEKFEFVLKEDSMHPKKENQKLDDSFDEIVQARPRSPFHNKANTIRTMKKKFQPISRSTALSHSPHTLPPDPKTSPNSVLDLPSPMDSYSDGPKISNLELLEQQKVKKVDDDDDSSEQSSILMDLSVL